MFWILGILLYLGLGVLALWGFSRIMPDFLYVERTSPQIWAGISLLISLLVWPSFIFDLIDYKSGKK